jgi:hypothetical protein
MNNPGAPLTGTVHGRIIEFATEVGLPDGQQVSVTLRPLSPGEGLPPGEGLRQSFGAWADDAAELDKYLEWNRQQRKTSRRSIEP